MGVASGKIILLGEHSVVYGKPGIAIPVKDVQIKCIITVTDTFSVESDRELYNEEKERLSELIIFIFFNLHLKKKNLHLSLSSTIPIASGLGSSAALSIAIIRSVSDYFDLQLSKDKINQLGFECEKFFHGTPSGIDNTVVTYEKPVYYEDGNIDFIKLKKPIKLVIANTGITADTKQVVSEVNKRFEDNKNDTEKIFEKIGKLVKKAKKNLEEGKNIGELLTKNHELLQKLDVSCPELDTLVTKAIEAGAFGAKLAGAGKGGNMIALVDDTNKEKVISNLKKISKEIIYTEVK